MILNVLVRYKPTLRTGSIGPITWTNADSSAKRTDTGVDRRRCLDVLLTRDDLRSRFRKRNKMD